MEQQQSQPSQLSEQTQGIQVDKLVISLVDQLLAKRVQSISDTIHSQQVQIISFDETLQNLTSTAEKILSKFQRTEIKDEEENHKTLHHVVKKIGITSPAAPLEIIKESIPPTNSLYHSVPNTKNTTTIPDKHTSVKNATQNSSSIHTQQSTGIQNGKLQQVKGANKKVEGNDNKITQDPKNTKKGEDQTHVKKDEDKKPQKKEVFPERNISPPLEANSTQENSEQHPIAEGSNELEEGDLSKNKQEDDSKSAQNKQELSQAEEEKENIDSSKVLAQEVIKNGEENSHSVLGENKAVVEPVKVIEQVKKPTDTSPAKIKKGSEETTHLKNSKAGELSKGKALEKGNKSDEAKSTARNVKEEGNGASSGGKKVLPKILDLQTQRSLAKNKVKEVMILTPKTTDNNNNKKSASGKKEDSKLESSSKKGTGTSASSFKSVNNDKSQVKKQPATSTATTAKKNVTTPSTANQTGVTGNSSSSLKAEKQEKSECESSSTLQNNMVTEHEDDENLLKDIGEESLKGTVDKLEYKKLKSQEQPQALINSKLQEVDANKEFDIEDFEKVLRDFQEDILTLEGLKNYVNKYAGQYSELLGDKIVFFQINLQNQCEEYDKIPDEQQVKEFNVDSFNLSESTKLGLELLEECFFDDLLDNEQFEDKIIHLFNMLFLILNQEEIIQFNKSKQKQQFIKSYLQSNESSFSTLLFYSVFFIIFFIFTESVLEGVETKVPALLSDYILKKSIKQALISHEYVIEQDQYVDLDPLTPLICPILKEVIIFAGLIETPTNKKSVAFFKYQENEHRRMKIAELNDIILEELK